LAAVAMAMFVGLSPSSGAEEGGLRPSVRWFAAPDPDEIILSFEVERCEWRELPGVAIDRSDPDVEVVCENVYLVKGHLYRASAARRCLEELMILDDDRKPSAIIAVEATASKDGPAPATAIQVIASLGGEYGLVRFLAEGRAKPFCKTVDVLPGHRRQVERYLESLKAPVRNEAGPSTGPR